MVSQMTLMRARLRASYARAKGTVQLEATRNVKRCFRSARSKATWYGFMRVADTTLGNGVGGWGKNRWSVMSRRHELANIPRPKLRRFVLSAPATAMP